LFLGFSSKTDRRFRATLRKSATFSGYGVIFQIDQLYHIASFRFIEIKARKMYEQFKSTAEGIGAEVHRFKTDIDALEFILTFLNKEGIADAPQSYAVWADGPFLADKNKKSFLQRISGLKFDVTCQAAADSRIGISDMSWALADTGSLVADQTSVEQRLVSTLPAIHIAIVPTGNILPGKAELFTRITPQQARYIAFISGPSRTADIERVLTIGVHGPKRLVVVFFDANEGGAQ
jgi:L-lactate dehydrogenase complex protein LldG